MKKLLCIIIAMTFIFTSIPVFSADTDNMEKVLLMVKKRLPETESYENFSSRTDAYDEKTSYEFEWSTETDDAYYSMSIAVTESGIITYYSIYDSTKEPEYTPLTEKISSEEAMKKAEILASKLNPEISDKLKISNRNTNESLHSDRFQFELTRMENGLPVYGNNGSVAVDINAEKILNYRLTWNEALEFESADNLISKEDAINSYKKNLGLKLVYQYTYKNRKREIYPVYIPSESSDTYINAKNGEAITITPSDDETFKGMNDSVTNGAGNPESSFSEAELKELSKLGSLKSEAELEKIIYDCKYTKPENNYKKIHYSLSRDYYNEEVYYAHFNFTKSGDEYGHISCTLNARTGEIIEYSFNEDENYAKDAKELKNISELTENTVKFLASEKLNEYHKERDDGYHRSYTRYVNSIPTPDRINITLNKYTGKLTYYGISYISSDFPDISEVISPEEAADGMFDNAEYSIYYLTDKTKGVPVYMVNAPVSIRIDPFSGKLLNYDNSVYVSDKIPEYTDISGHWAEEIIKKLSSYGIGFYEEAFKPDEYITAEEYISLLVSAFISGYPTLLKKDYDKTSDINTAKDRKILKDGESLTETLSRKMAAVYMVRILGAEKYASINEIYKSLYPDVSEYTGYISILSGLGIMKGDNYGNFNPDSLLTRAQAMTIIYNALNNN